MDLSPKFDRLNTLHQSYLTHGSFSQWDEREKELIKNNFTYHSTKIEGLTLTYGETIKFLKDNVVRKGMKIKDIYDLRNHKEVLDKIFLSFQLTEFTEETIKNLHSELMKDDAQWDVQDAYLAPAGKYKTDNNFTYRSGGKPHIYLEFEKVPAAIKALVNTTQQQLTNSTTTNPEQHPVSIISHFHYEFLQIHPFSDGNGRMARLLTTLLFLKHKFPPIIIEEQDRENYFQAIIASENDSKRLPFITFMIAKSIDALTLKLKKTSQQEDPEQDLLKST